MSALPETASRKCTHGSGAANPHTSVPKVSPPKICDTILDHIGNTPLVRINKISKSAGLQCELLAKCEFFNAGGSVKDRIGKRMILDAEKQGRINPGDVLIEPTSGNTGIGLALTAALRGYRMLITLPEKMSQEKVDVLKALGAEITRTPTEAAFDSPESHIGVAKRLNEEIPNSHILDQYSNPSNPMAHYEGTAEEILEQCGGRIDMMVVSAGTGGTISGIARKFKEKCPSCKIVGVDPKGSILAYPDTMNDEMRLQSYKVEGIGYDFIPDVLDRTLVDEWVKTTDKESFIMARRMIREEGLLCGGSCGAAMCGALRAAQSLGPGQRCVVLLADSIRNYMSKHLNDGWMVENGFYPPPEPSPAAAWWATQTVGALGLSTVLTINPTVTVKQGISMMTEHGIDQVPVVSDSGVDGVVTVGSLTKQLSSGRVVASSPVSECLFKQFRQVPITTTLHELARIFDKDHFVLVCHQQKVMGDDGSFSERTSVMGVVTRVDLLAFIGSKEE
jgi:cystathionine beta-synthase